MNLKTPFLIALALLIAGTTQAQKPERQREIGLTFFSLNGFGLTYRTGHAKALWRFSSVAGSHTNKLWANQKQWGVNAGAAFGREYRAPVSEKLDFRYGVELAFNYDYLEQRITQENTNYDIVTNTIIQHRRVEAHKTISYTPGLRFIIGLNYNLSEHFIVGAEMLPGGSYSFGTEKREVTDTRLNLNTSTPTDVSGFNYGLSSGNVKLSLVYKF